MNISSIYERLTEMRIRIESIPDATAECARYNQDELLSLRKDEILLGRDSDGQPFRPTYTEDPYFKSAQSANAYANYKLRIESIHNARIEHVLNYPNKDNDTPNLRFTTATWAPGKNFQDSMFISINPESLIIGSTYKDANLINAKYNNRVYDLGPGAKDYFWKWILFPYLYDHIWN